MTTKYSERKSYIVIDIAFSVRGRALGLDDLIFEYKVSLQHANRKKAECENIADKKDLGRNNNQFRK